MSGASHRRRHRRRLCTQSASKAGRSRRLRRGRRQLPRGARRAARFVSARRRASPRSAARCIGSSCAMRWWPGCCPKRRGSSIRSTPTFRSSGRSSSPGCRAPAPPPCTGCSAPTRRIRVCSCGWRSSRSRGRRAKPGSDNPVLRQLDAQFTKAHEENPDYTGLHFMTADEVEECWQLLRQSLHSVSYETLAHLPTLCRVAGAAGLDAVVSAAPQEPAADRPQRRREALGAEEPEPPVRARRVDGDLPRRAGGAMPSAGRDDHGVDVLAGRSTPPKGWSNDLRRCDDRRGRAGDLVARSGAVQCRTGQA